MKIDTAGFSGDVSDSDVSDDEASLQQPLANAELEQPSINRHAFLFRHNGDMSESDLRKLHPLPSQVPFLLDAFSENVNFLTGIVYMPTVTRVARSLRGNSAAAVSLPQEALLFSIYYAAITSMEEDEVSVVTRLRHSANR